MFVTVDGLDGSGKTTVVGELARKAQLDGVVVTIAAFPGTTELGKSIRQFLMEPTRRRDAATEALLLFANFREVYSNFHSTASQNILIADRFFTSTVGYQGALSLEAKQFVRRALELTFPDPIIDVRLILDIPYEVGQARVASRSTLDRFDIVERETFEKIRQEILESAIRDDPKAVILENSGPLDSTIADAWAAIAGHKSYPGCRPC